MAFADGPRITVAVRREDRGSVLNVPGRP